MKHSKSFDKFNNNTYFDNNCYNKFEHRLVIMSKLIKKHSTVLDLGCGTGFFLEYIKSNCKSVQGIEISSRAANIGQKKGLNIKVADLHSQFPFNDNHFDTIIAGEIIEHIYDTDFFLNEVKRILKPNGDLIISTPNIATLGRRLMLLVGINPSIETSLENAAGHIRYFTKSSLEQLLNKHNFNITVFTSDTINFSNDGKIQSKLLSRLFPTFGARLIIKATNNK